MLFARFLKTGGAASLLLFASLPSGGAERVDLVTVDKSERLLELIAEGRIVRTFAIALGGAPIGHKQREGDEHTPEGRYVLDWRNPRSAFHRSIHISYPDASDRAAAAVAGAELGGMIMIHGQPNGFGWVAPLLQRFDWTNGCIAVSDADMDAIWALVPDGTPVEIVP